MTLLKNSLFMLTKSSFAVTELSASSLFFESLLQVSEQLTKEMLAFCSVLKPKKN